MDKVLLTDVDGVLVDWETAFEDYVIKRGYSFNENKRIVYSMGAQLGISHEEAYNLISGFNHSEEFGNLLPLRDSVEYITKLHNEGWHIIAITTAGEHPETWPLRRQNLDKVFGKNVINELYVLPLHGDKSIELVKYRDLYWIEDKPSNAELGYKYNLKPLLMDGLHNRNYTGRVPRVNIWEEIYRIING